jgi:hypothetical protein
MNPTLIVLMALFLASPPQQGGAEKARTQNPSPMTESTRRHLRIPEREFDGIRFGLSGMFSNEVDVFVPRRTQGRKNCKLLIHFHGAAFVVRHAASLVDDNLVAATVQLGSGSAVYGNAFTDAQKFVALKNAIHQELRARLSNDIKIEKTILSGFSAGYGAIRTILSHRENSEQFDSVLLLDGIHAGYSPEGRVLYEGGKVESRDLEEFLNLAREASRKESRKRFLITHSEIFPGTFASTTEACDFLLSELGLKRTPVLEWGPGGMQLLSLARKNHFKLLGFAGNSAPDHLDHFHGMDFFLRQLLQQ